MKISEHEFTELASRVAQYVKAKRLARLPGMDDVAVALNSRPTYDEHMNMKEVMRVLETLGYEIHKV